MLWILRHADAEDTDGRPDAERPLTEKGRAQARAVGGALAALGVRLDACLSSPLVRALDTAVLACEPLGVDVHVTGELGGGRFDPDRLASGFGAHVLLVGHNPDVAQAVFDVTGARVRMRKAALAGIDDGELHVFLRPAELAAIASRRAG
ncbi:MAG TPA: histidine phosphatase family protein [Conexibacter sp.]|nr:histidine phosphatase family protein [Conexibacter sp.]